MKPNQNNIFIRYINARFSLIQLQAFETIAKAAAEISRLFLLSFLGLLTYVLLSFAAIECYTEKVGPRSEAFLIIALANTVILILLIVVKNQIFVIPLSKMLEKILFNATDQFEKQLEAVKDERTWLKIKLLKMKYTEESQTIENEFLQYTEWEFWQHHLYTQARNLFTYHRLIRWAKVVYYRFKKKKEI